MNPHRLRAQRGLARLGLLLALLSPAAQATNPLPAALPAPLQQQLQTLLDEEQLAGMVVATLQDGQVRTAGFGFAHRPTRRPMPADAKVHGGSIAKTLVSLAVLRLVSQGRLDLDAPVASLLPTLPIANPWLVSHPLRLRHLLDMTGGLADLRLWQFSAPTLPPTKPWPKPGSATPACCACAPHRACSSPMPTSATPWPRWCWKPP